ncbi:MAG: hypothetical protein H7195_04935 [Chryseobacterium sp.]|nr:hypothetical protein [Chryseobacterium sp.]
MKLKSEETKLIGNWIFDNEKIITDPVSERINYLIKNYLIKIKTDESGWDILYQDIEDKRYWELIFSQSNLQGGGPPSLLSIDETIAKKKYNILNK